MRIVQVMCTALLLSFAQIASAQDLRVFFKNRCPVTDSGPTLAPESAALATVGLAVGSKLVSDFVDLGVGALLKALKPDAKTLSQQANARGFFDGSGFNQELGCLIVVVGHFVPAKQAAGVFPFKSEYGATNDANSKLAEFLFLDSAPIFYLESRFTQSADMSAMTWEPRYLYLNRFMIQSFLAGDRRDVALTIQLSQPGGTKFSEIAFVYRNILAGTHMSAETLGEMTGAWSAMPVRASDARTTSSKGAPIANFPFTVTANYVETPKPNQLTTLIVGALETQTDEVKTAVKDAFDPKRQQERAKSRVSLSRKAVEDYAAAWRKYADDCKGPFDAAYDVLVLCQLLHKDLSAARDAATRASNDLGGLTIPPLPPEPKKAS